MAKRTKKRSSKRSTRRSYGLGSPPDKHAELAREHIENGNEAMNEADKLIAQGKCRRAYRVLSRGQSSAGHANSEASASDDDRLMEEAFALEESVGTTSASFAKACVLDGGAEPRKKRGFFSF